jgi:glycosyltransferase involved in cell wall biosynthesis
MPQNHAIEILACIEAYSVTGPAKNLLLTARALSAGEHAPCRIRVVTFQRDGIPNPFIEACRKADVSCDVIRERRRFDIGVARQLRNLIDLHRPDIIQTHNTKSHLLVRAGGFHQRIPWIAFNHGYTAEDLKVRLYNQADRWSLRGAHRVVVVCEAFGAALRRWGVPGPRILVRHNSISPAAATSSEDIQRLRETLNIPLGSAVLLTVGRLSEEKGHRDLIAAISELKQRGAGQSFRLVILGAGPELERLQTFSKELGVSELIIFAGTTKNVFPYYSLAEIFILPSHSEGSPNVLLEAMMSGLPVLATNVGGVPEIVQSRMSGLLVAAKDIKAMAGAMAELLGSPGLREALGLNAQAWVTRRHSREEYVGWMLNLYNEVAGRCSAPTVNRADSEIGEPSR